MVILVRIFVSRWKRVDTDGKSTVVPLKFRKSTVVPLKFRKSTVVPLKFRKSTVVPLKFRKSTVVTVDCLIRNIRGSQEVL